MKRKILGMFVCMLVISTAISVAGTAINDNEHRSFYEFLSSDNNKDTRTAECEIISENELQVCTSDANNIRTQVTLEPRNDDIHVYLSEKFQLKSQQRAVVQDYKQMRIKYAGEVSNACTEFEDCPPSPMILLQVEIPEEELPSGQDSAAGMEIIISVGENKEVFGSTISLLGLEKGVATLIVTI